MSGYQRINFKDQNVERPKTYDVTNNPDGSITLIESFGNVEELGTPINQENMNHIEDGIDAVSFSKFNIDSVYKKDDLITDIQDSELKIFKSLKDNNFGHLPSENDFWEEVEIAGGNGSGYNLGDTKITDRILEGDEAKGWALQGTYVSGALYPDFYNKWLEKKNASAEIEVTLGGSTLTMFRNSNGLQFYNIADKSIVDTFYETYGIADYYGIDEENERIFLPRDDWFAVTGTKGNTVPAYGNGMTLGLTDGTSYAGMETGSSQVNYCLYGITGVYGTPIGTNESGIALTTKKSVGVTNDPTKSGIIADNPVKPNTNKYLYYCVGNTVVNDSEINAGALVAEMEQKANTTLDNVMPTQEFKNQSMLWGLPDYENAIVVKTGKNDNTSSFYYTAPSNGLFSARANSSGATRAVAVITVNGNQVGVNYNVGTSGYNPAASTIAPVSKGDEITYIAGGSSNVYVQFIPLKGVN